MSQLSLFESQRPAAAARAPDLVFVRKYLGRTLAILREADILPWGEAETAVWERRFPELAALLPDEEARELVAGFQAELARLRSGS